MKDNTKLLTKEQLILENSHLNSLVNYLRDERKKQDLDLDYKWGAMDFFRQKVVPLLLFYLSLENKKLFLSRLVLAFDCSSENELRDKFEQKNLSYQFQFINDLITSIYTEEFHQHYKLQDSFLEKEKIQKHSLFKDVNDKFSHLNLERQTFFKEYFILTYGTSDLSLLTYQDLLDINSKIS